MPKEYYPKISRLFFDPFRVSGYFNLRLNNESHSLSLNDLNPCLICQVAGKDNTGDLHIADSYMVKVFILFSSSHLYIFYGLY